MQPSTAPLLSYVSSSFVIVLETEDPLRQEWKRSNLPRNVLRSCLHTIHAGSVMQTSSKATAAIDCMAVSLVRPSASTVMLKRVCMLGTITAALHQAFLRIGPQMPAGPAPRVETKHSAWSLDSVHSIESELSFSDCGMRRIEHSKLYTRTTTSWYSEDTSILVSPSLSEWSNTCC